MNKEIKLTICICLGFMIGMCLYLLLPIKYSKISILSGLFLGLLVGLIPYIQDWIDSQYTDKTKEA